jgi:outer membrane usher protein
VPLGSTITLTGTKTPNPVGYDGEAYVQNLARRNRATVIEPDGSRCVLTFKFTPEPRVLPTIGPVTCVAAGGPAP